MATGFPVKANYATGDVLTAANMNDLSGTLNYLQYSANGFMAGKNAIINGNFDIWQRGTSSTTASAGYQTADRWYCFGSAGVTWAQETTTVPSGSQYAFKISTSTTQQPVMTQVIETLNARQFAGQNAVLSFYAQASASTAMTMEVNYSTSVDTAASGTFTAITATSGGSGTATTGSFARLSGVYAIPSTAKTIQVRIYPTSNIVNGTSIYIGQVQLELGVNPSTFTRAGGTIQGELAACQRYYYRQTAAASYTNFGSGQAGSSTTAQIGIKCPVTMRTAPSTLDYSTLRVQDESAGYTVTALVINTVFNSTDLTMVQATVASGLTQQRYYSIGANNSTSAYIGLGAEL